ncbi:hypothetical protein FHW23_001220 [Curtobacterium pusillum]|uniref:DUF4190 domain-containing protein n=1 Tax=Curtobacterium pusillum TaxID=69373 RepID=A0AAW3T5N1_9MICO|nr:hypothetical protein [Curtobacterium pusillum]MBA8989974.1 hypothetical protein [Curtobacterium pusillum]
MASHRMPDEDRPRRTVPAWVTAPPESADDGLEARPAAVASAPTPETVAPVSALPAPQSAPAFAEDDIVVPDYPPQEHLLPPAPTSPAVHTVSFATTSIAPAPVSPIDAAPPPPVAPAVPAVPVVGQPRFSVPGLEHVVVEGVEPEPSGPIGYRTPARFAHQRPLSEPRAQQPTPTRSFDAVIAPPVSAPAPVADPFPALPSAAVPSAGLSSAAGTTAVTDRAGTTQPTKPATTTRTRTRATASTTAPSAGATGSMGAEPRLQADQTTDAARKPLVGAGQRAVLGAVAGLATLGLAAWWFLAPATVHGVGLVLGALALLLSIVTLRNRTASWQRPIALLGAVLGGVGTLVLLWAVASAVLSLAGVTLPDLTGSGTVPTLAP